MKKCGRNKRMKEKESTEGSEFGNCFFCKRSPGIYYGLVEVNINGKHSEVPLCQYCFMKAKKLKDDKIELQGHVICL